LKRWLKRLGWGVLGLLGLALVLVVGTLLVLQTGFGGRVLRDQLLTRVNAGIQGELTVDSLRLRGTTLVLEGVRLEDPEGELVAEVERLVVSLRPGHLLRRTVLLDQVRVEQPSLHVVQDAEGTNLQRALAPAEEKPEKDEEGTLPVDVVVRDLRVEGGHLSFVSLTGEEPFEAELDGLEVNGELALREGGERTVASLRATARARAPVQGPLRLELEARGEGERTALTVDGALAGATLKARATVDGEEQLSATVEQLVVPPGFVRAFTGGWPLQVSVRAAGEVTRRGDKVDAELTFHAAEATVRAQVEADLARPWAERVEVTGEDIDLSQLVENGPRSDVSFRLDARGGGGSLQTLDGELTLTAPASPMAGETFGPVEVRARAEDGVLVLERLEAVLPGVALTARGRSDGEQVRFYARVAARSLSTFARTVGKLAGPKGLDLEGHGALAVRVEGPLQAPALHATARLPTFRYQEHSARGVRLRARVDNLREPLAADAQLQLSARRAQVGERQLVSPRLSFGLRERRLTFAARTRGSVRLALSARAMVDPDARGLRLSSLSLRYPEARWVLEGPATLRLEEDLMQVQGFVLRSGPQRLAVSARREGDTLQARVEVGSLLLGQLPRDLVTLERPLQGVVNLDLTVEGRVQAPVLTGEASIARGRYGGLEDLDASLEARYAKDRAEGQLRASALGSQVRLDFDLPLVALRTGAAQPLSADLVVEEVSLSTVARALGEAAPAEGVFSARARLRGTARAPTVEASAAVDGLSAGEHPPVDVRFRVHSGNRDRLHAEVHAQADGEPSVVTLHTPWTLGRLLHRPPTVEQALRAPLVLSGTLHELPVPYPDPSGHPLAPPRFARLSGEVDVRGSALDPRGKVALELDDFGAGELWPLQASAILSLEGVRQSLEAKVTQGARQLFTASARVDATVSRLRRARRLGTVPVAVDVEAGPLSVGALQAVVPSPERPGEEGLPALRGTLHGRVQAKGTLEAPVVAADLSVHGLGAAEASGIGDLSVRFEHQDGRSRLAADLLSRGGELALRASAPFSLALSALQAGLDPTRVPVHATLKARDFDPSFLSRTVPGLLAVGGRIDAAAELQGPVALPEVKGRFSWNDGLVSLEGQGRYEDIRLRVRGTEQELVVEEAFARSGEGTARLSGTLVRRGAQASLRAEATLDEFPIVSDFQKVATVSLRAEAEGEASAEEILISALRIPEARVELPPNARRELHEIEPPDGIVWYHHGEPLDGTGGAGLQEDTAEGPSVGPRVEIHLEAPRNIWVRGQDLNVEVGFGEGFRILHTDQPHLFGELHILRGRVEVLGRRFELDPDSTVTFTGPAEAPRLNVIATHENRREDVTITLRIVGQGEELEIEPSSDPPLTDTEIYTLIATGRRSLQPGARSSDSGGAATTALGALAAAQLQQGLREVLPLDILSIEQGETGVGTARVEAGTYLSDRLYLGIASEIGGELREDENRNELLMEYQLWRRWMLELEYGDARQGSADLIWRKQY
jgi:translocation and assembly module TamB